MCVTVSRHDCGKREALVVPAQPLSDEQWEKTQPSIPQMKLSPAKMIGTLMASVMACCHHPRN